MSLPEELRALAERIPGHLAHAGTEEATKTALVLPFIAALGYNIFDPREVIPEFTADVGVKKGEKVDYAIMRDDKPIILFECKAGTADLSSAHMSQLYRYFSVTDARVGILTNGVTYQFYSDLDARNKMDERPFMTIDLRHLRAADIEELQRLAKGVFDVEQLLAAAEEMKYTGAMVKYLASVFSEPDDAFQRILIASAYDGNITKYVRDRFHPMIRRSLRRFLNDQVNERLRSALDRETPAQPKPAADSSEPAEPIQEIEDDNGDSDIETTTDEWEAYFIVKAILRRVVEADRIAMRDLKSYCGILLDDNNRKPLCRLHFNRTQNYLGVFDSNKNETRHAIQRLDDIYNFADELQATVAYYEGDK